MRSVAAVVAFVVCVHAGLWALLQRQQPAASIDRPLTSISYSPYARSQHPDNGDRPTADQIRADLKILSLYTHTIRTYSSTGGVELVPAIAAEFGLKVTLGIWIDKNEARNEREIQAAIALARRHSNINAIVVGNETTLRLDLLRKEATFRAQPGKTVNELKAEHNVEELIKLIQRVKRISPVPVTTGEIWTVWIDHPQLASAVDFIAAHILPYWDGFPAGQAVDKTIEFYNKLRRTHPGKRIVVAEFGWPSAGYNMLKANPGRIEQAAVLRDFVSRAEAYGIDYNIIEAFDQPWKTNEGGVGMYWGMFDAARQPKFAWTGPVGDLDHWKVGGIALLLGLLLSLPILARSRATIGEAMLLAFAANVVAAWFATVFAFWQTHYFVLGAAFALALGMVLLVPLVVIALARIEEIATVAFGRRPRRLLPPAAAAADGFAPKVSIHIPAYREPPEMLNATLDAVAKLDYPNFECVVVINNTPDPAFWRPVEDHCLALGERFKFVNADNVAGYKAGALRLALAHSADDAEIIGVIDADYVVRSDWLKDLVPAFSDPKVGMIQAPQDHRDGGRTVMHHAMNGEYAGFFDIGMVQRNEANAIIVHGTMCLIRRAALISTGGWSSDTIVEDCDLGLTVLEQGWQIHYTNRRYGYGLLPDTFESYKRQRHRWAYGGFQILRKHWRSSASACRRAQPRSETRVRARLAQLAGSGSDRGDGRTAQPALDAGGRFRRHRHSRQDPDHPDPGCFRDLARPFHRALSAAGRCSPRPDGRRGDCRHVGAMDGGARCRLRDLQGDHPLHAHRQGRHHPQGPRLSRVLGGGAGRAAADRRDRGGGHELQANSRGLYLRGGAGRAEPAVPGGGGNRHARRHAVQRIRLLAQHGGEGGGNAAAAGGQRSDVRGQGSGALPSSDIRHLSAVSTSRTQYDVPIGMISSLKS